MNQTTDEKNQVDDKDNKANKNDDKDEMNQTDDNNNKDSFDGDNNSTKQTNLDNLSSFYNNDDDITYYAEKRMQGDNGNDGVFNISNLFLIFFGFVFLFVFIVCCIKLNYRQDDESIENFTRDREYEMKVKGNYQDSSYQSEFAGDDIDENLDGNSPNSLKNHDIEIIHQSAEEERVRIKKLTIAFDDDVQAIELETNRDGKHFEDIEFH